MAMGIHHEPVFIEYVAARVSGSAHEVARSRPRRPFREERLLQLLLLIFGVVWIATAVDPADRGIWALENSVAVLFMILLLGGYRRWRFTNLSYVTITIFMILHTLGAYTTYEEFPAGRWVQQQLDLSRNHYDRFVHFCFGLLMSEPCRELLRHYVHVSLRWARMLAIPFVLTVSTVFELIESWAARIVRPDLGAAFLAAQGDEWDAQKDVTIALVGALSWYVGDWLFGRRRGHHY